MEIYVLKWGFNGTVPADGAVYTDKERAEKHAQRLNENLNFFDKLFTCNEWKVAPLNLRIGKKGNKIEEHIDGQDFLKFLEQNSSKGGGFS